MEVSALYGHLSVVRVASGGGQGTLEQGRVDAILLNSRDIQDSRDAISTAKLLRQALANQQG